MRLFITPRSTALVLGICSVICLAGAIWPASPLTQVEVWFGASAVLALMTVGTLAARRYPRTPLVALVLAVVVATWLLSACQTPSGVVTTALGLVVAGQLSGLFGGRRAVRIVLPVVLVALAVGMIAAPVPFQPVTWVVLATITVVTASLVTALVDRLREFATTDDLTGVLTRAAFDDKAVRVMDRAARQGRPVTVVCLDVDDFKEINDTRGHQAGDEVLVRLVDGWRDALGRDDLIGRMGGDEFAVVLAGRTEEGAEAWAREAGAPREPGDPTWSHGAAQVRSDEPVRDALARADAALYARKGRRVEGVR